MLHAPSYRLLQVSSSSMRLKETTIPISPVILRDRKAIGRRSHSSAGLKWRGQPQGNDGSTASSSIQNKLGCLIGNRLKRGLDLRTT
jgi:hypothetical protein